MRITSRVSVLASICLVASTAAAVTIHADGETTEIGDAKIAAARSEMKKCFEATDARGQDACTFYHKFKTDCGYTLPTEFNDEGVAIAMMYGQSGAGNTLAWAETNYGLFRQMCTNMDAHATYKPALQKKVKKVVFDGKLKRTATGEPTVQLNNGVLTLGIAPYNAAGSAMPSEWGTGAASGSPLLKYLDGAL